MSDSPVSDTAPRRLRVLIADDGELNRTVALFQLAAMGHEAEAVENGALAVEKVESGAFQVVLMDCEMPVLDGYGATRAIRQREAASKRRGAARHTWIIALTAESSNAQREACAEAGMDDFVIKPAPPGALAAALARVPANAHARLDLSALEAKGLASILPRLMEIFERDAPKHLAEMQSHADAGNTNELARAAHALRGAAANLHAHTLRELCARVETLARAGDAGAARAEIGNVTQELQEVRAELQRRR